MAGFRRLPPGPGPRQRRTTAACSSGPAAAGRRPPDRPASHERRRPAAAPDGTRWLFPGRVSVRPLTALAVTRQLNQHGIHLRAGRTAALVDLAGQLPPAVLASLLGMHPATADRWSRRIASDWAAYLDARARATSEAPPSLAG